MPVPSPAMADIEIAVARVDGRAVKAVARHQHQAADAGRGRSAARFADAGAPPGRRPPPRGRAVPARRRRACRDRADRARAGSCASSAGSARPAKRSSGAARAMATARSASAAKPSPLRSLVETTACLLPTRTRSPRSSPSERCDSSTAPSRTSTDSDTPRTATASAWSAPARLAAATSRSAMIGEGRLVEER